MNFLDVFAHQFQLNATIVIAYTACIIAIVSFFVARFKWMREHEILLGILFGLLAIGTDAASMLYNPELHQQEQFNIIVSIGDAPSLVASFCFSPIAGVVAGIITTIERAFLSLHGFESFAWYFSAGITLLIALYGAALRKWVFNNEPPLFITGAIIAAFAEILRFSLIVFLLPYITRFEEDKTRIYQETLNEYLNTLYPLDKVQAFFENDLTKLSGGEFESIKNSADSFATVLGNGIAEAQCLEIISHYLPYMFVGVAAAVFFAILFTLNRPLDKKEISERLYSIRIPALCASVIFMVGWGSVIKLSIDNAKQQSTQTLLEASQGIFKRATDRVAFSMHSDAVAMKRSGYFKTLSDITNEKLEQYARTYDIDEISVFKRNGDFIASSACKRLKPGVNNISNVSGWARFKDIYVLNANVYTGADGKFMYDIFDNEEPGDMFTDASGSNYIAYMAMTFSTQDGQECIIILGYTWKHVEHDCIAFIEPLLQNKRLGKYGCVIAVKEKTDGKGNSSAEVFFQPFGHPEIKGLPIDDVGMRKGQWRNQASNMKIREAKICGIWHWVLPLMDNPISMGNGEKLHLVLALPYAEHYFLATRQISVAGLALFLTCILFIVMKIWSAKKQEVIDELRKADMKIAFQIQDAELQEDWLDNTKPCKIVSTMVPAKEVGGDFYDYYTLPDGRVVITIADVSGKGVPAAIFMMKAKFTLKTSVLSEKNLAAAVSKSNQLLCQNNDAQMFVTVWIGIFNPMDNELEFISAGHNPPLVRHCDGNVEWVKGTLRKKPPLATFEKAQYQPEKIRLKIGDRLFLYTDGVTEAINEEGELYGENRLEVCVADTTAKSVLNTVVTNSIEKFRKKAEQTDDITMLTMEVNDEPNRPTR